MPDDDVPVTQKILSELLKDDTLLLSEISEKVLLMTKKQEIKRKYNDKIKTRTDDGRPYVYVNRKQVIAPSYDELIDKLYDMEYGKINFSFAELYPEWMIWRRDCTSTSGKTQKEDANNWNRYLQDEPIINIPIKNLKSKDFVKLFRKWTKDRQMTRKQFNNVKSVVNGLYYYAIEEGIVDFNPVKSVNCKQFTFKPVNNDDDVFTVNDRRALLTYLANDNDMYSLAIQLDFQLVARIGELLSLKWTDIVDGNLHIQSQHLIEQTLNDDLTFSKREHVNVDHVKGNTDQGFRFQPLTDEAIRLLARIKEQNPTGEFILMKDGRQLNADTFNEHLKKHCIACNVPPRSSHKIRFCVASMLYDAGVPLTTLQKLLGHTTTAMTLHYLRRVKPSKDTSNLINAVLC